MNIIAVECPACRLTDSVPAADLLVELLEPAGDDPARAATVCWICATCADLATVEVSEGLLIALMAAGVTVLDARTHELTMHPEAPAGGAPLTTDDLLELHESLESDSWFDELTSLEPPPAVT